MTKWVHLEVTAKERKRKKKTTTQAAGRSGGLGGVADEERQGGIWKGAKWDPLRMRNPRAATAAEERRRSSEVATTVHREVVARGEPVAY